MHLLVLVGITERRQENNREMTGTKQEDNGKTTGDHNNTKKTGK